MYNLLYNEIKNYFMKTILKVRNKNEEIYVKNC